MFVLFDVSAVVAKRLVVRQGVARYSKLVRILERLAVNEPVLCGSSRYTSRLRDMNLFSN